MKNIILGLGITATVLLQLAILGIVGFEAFKLHKTEAQVELQSTQIEQLNSKVAQLEAKPAEAGEQEDYPSHIDLIDFLKTITPKEGDPDPSMWTAAEPSSKIRWTTPGNDGSHDGEVFISMDGKPTLLYMDTNLVAEPWHVRFQGTFHSIRWVRLSAGFSWNSYRDIGEYLVEKKLAEKVDFDDDADCSRNWYKIQMKGYQPLWMGSITDAGSGSGMTWIAFNYEGPGSLYPSCDALEIDE